VCMLTRITRLHVRACVSQRAKAWVLKMRGTEGLGALGGAKVERGKIKAVGGQGKRAMVS
jgi:hypothetical protein